MKNFFLSIWNWHGHIGKALSIFMAALLAAALIGIVTGTTKCREANEIVYTNIFLNESFELHNSNYEVSILSALTKEEITIENKKGSPESLSGHYVDVEIKISQKPESEMKAHTFDRDDFKLKGHTGVYLPLNDIASIVGWDMVDFHWDKKDNGFVISSADIKTRESVNDYTYVGKTISPGMELNFHIYLPVSNKAYSVETSLMVLEIDFYWGGAWSEERRGEDVILLPRPGNLNNIGQEGAR